MLDGKLAKAIIKRCFVFFYRFSDVWCFNLEDRKWHLPTINGIKPMGRFGHSQVMYSLPSILEF
jgi:hypothetical protein